MNDPIKSTKRNYLLEDVLRNRKGKANYKYFSPIQNSRTKLHKGNILINKLYIKELSKLSDRPILVNKAKVKTNLQREQYLSKDQINKKLEKNSLSIDINNNKYKNNFLKSGNNRNNKNFIIFTECPKKISDYILKNNNKKKVYQLTYFNENDLNYEKFINERFYNNNNYNYNSNRDYNPKLMKKKKKMFNLNIYDDQNYLINDIYNNTNANTNNNTYRNKFNNTFSKNIKNLKKDYSVGNLCVNNQNNDQLKVLKIQSVWRGYLIRKILLKSLNNLYNIMKLINSLYAIFYNNCKPFYKLFLYSLLKKKNDIITSSNKKEKSRNININSKSNIRPNRYFKENKILNNNANNNNVNNNINNVLKEKKNLNNISVIDKKNINLFIPADKKNIKVFAPADKENINIYIPGDKKTNQLIKKNFVYKRKKNSPKNSPLLTKKNFNINKINNNNINNRENNNLTIKGKTKIYDGFKNINYKNKSKMEIVNIVNYINKKNILLYSPLFLYRLRIMQKMKLVEYRYKCLFNILKIKEKAILYKYFNKYRNIASSYTANNMLLDKQLKKNTSDNEKDKLNNNKNNNYRIGKKYYLNNNKQNINSNNNNLSNNSNNLINVNKSENNFNNSENPLNIKSNIKNRENNSNKKNPNNIINKKNEILNKIIHKKESKINNLLLNNIFNKWKNTIKNNIIIFPRLRNTKYNKYKSTKIVLNDNKISVIPKKKCIKVRKIKSDRSNYFSHAKSINSGKITINSFESDNINVRKMKVQKIKISTDSKDIKNSLTKDLEPKYINNDFVDNSQFIQKIANISRKISNKNNIFKCFIFWKKKTKEIN